MCDQMLPGRAAAAALGRRTGNLEEIARGHRTPAWTSTVSWSNRSHLPRHPGACHPFFLKSNPELQCVRERGSSIKVEV